MRLHNSVLNTCDSRRRMQFSGGAPPVAAVDLFITNDRRLARYTVPRIKAIRALADVEIGKI